MKKLFVILSVLLLTAGLLPVSAQEAGPMDWFLENNYWKTVANGHWSSDPKDQITDGELAKLFDRALLQQNAVQWCEPFFIVVKDVEEQRKIIGDAWGKPEDMATEGTVTVLVMADQILSKEEGHASEYEGYYMHVPQYGYFDSGLTCGLLNVAAASLGYYTHYFGTVNGEYAPKDLADGKVQSMSRYVKEDYIRGWGFPGAYGEELKEEHKYPVAGNCVLVAAVVIGKPAAGEDLATWGTSHARPANWAIWDGSK